jgi:hypothetical protein
MPPASGAAIAACNRASRAGDRLEANVDAPSTLEEWRAEAFSPDLDLAVLFFRNPAVSTDRRWGNTA